MALHTREQGRAGEVRPHYGLRTGDFVAELLEDNPDLRFPNSVRIYDRMARTDGQIGGVLRAWRHPIKTATWDLTGGDVDAQVLDAARIEIGLPAPGDEASSRRNHQGIKWQQHLNEALSVLVYGFAPFEKVWEQGDALPGQSYPGKEYWTHIRKLAYRPPRQVQDILVGEDGGLRAITQRPKLGEVDQVRVDVQHLVWYVSGREGADWTGLSVLRNAYKDWLIKEDVTRMNVTSIYRGTGVPVVQYDDDSEGGKAEAEQAARAFSSGPDHGVIYPRGVEKPYLQGITGAVRDPLPTLAHHNQEISKGALTMFMDLGHDAGARSLGETFYTLFLDAVQELADMIAETFTEYVLRPWTEYNFGEGTPYPVLTPGEIGAADLLEPDGLKALVDAGVITATDELEDHVGGRYGLPKRTASRGTTVAVEGEGAPDPGTDPDDVADDNATPTGGSNPRTGTVGRGTAAVPARHLSRARELLQLVSLAEQDLDRDGAA